ncbi:SLC38A3 [Branchiostoma lanceolatum]|uniref:SLC38A3 protein n=1 Tax=Branchiostoma lanceolatum TaxID=7740 RepID=A0A8K0EQX3_BRALA|nr:SLC38A3 [Branchiostoma lanceolatum]
MATVPVEDAATSINSDYFYGVTASTEREPLLGAFHRESSIQTSIGGLRQGDSHEAQGKASFGMSVFNLMNAILGSGILGLAYAMSESGVVLFSILMMMVAIIASYSIHLLLRMCEISGVKSYEDVGYAALRKPGKFLAAGAILLQNIGAMSSYLFIVKTEFPSVIRTFMHLPPDAQAWYLNGDYLLLLVAGLVIAPLAALRRIEFLGYTSGLSISCMVFFTSVVVAKKFSYPCPVPPQDWSNVTIPSNASWFPLMNSTNTDHMVALQNSSCVQDCTAKMVILTERTAYALPTMAFSFVCHTAVLPVYVELKRGSVGRMQNVANASIGISFILYMLSALFGYLTFYGNVHSELLESYNSYNPHDAVILVCRLAVLVAVILTVPVVHFPARKAITLMLFPGCPFSWLVHLSITLCLMVLVNCLAIFVPDIKDVFGLAGATSSTFLVFILPGLFYLKVSSERRFALHKILAAVIAGGGTCLCVLSLTLITSDIIHRAT